jgi:hypothetical protein
MMTMEEKLQTLAKAVGVNGAKTMHFLGECWLIMTEPLTSEHRTLSFSPYTMEQDYSYLLKELRCATNYSLTDELNEYILTTNLIVRAISHCEVYYCETRVLDSQDFVKTVRGATLDLLVEVLTTSANTTDAVQSTEP